MIFKQDYGGILQAIITDAFVFDGTVLDIKKVPTRKFFTQNAAWDTGAEVTIVSQRVVDVLGLKPFEHSKVMGIGGVEDVDVYRIHLGLPNGYLYKNLIVYCSDINDYDILIGMDLIAQSDFFLTNINGNNQFIFQIPATGLVG